MKYWFLIEIFKNNLYLIFPVYWNIHEFISFETYVFKHNNIPFDLNVYVTKRYQVWNKHFYKIYIKYFKHNMLWTYYQHKVVHKFGF